MDRDTMIRNTANMAERAHRQWQDTPRWRFLIRAKRHDNYRGWQGKLDELRREGTTQ